MIVGTSKRKYPEYSDNNTALKITPAARSAVSGFFYDLMSGFSFLVFLLLVLHHLLLPLLLLFLFVPFVVVFSPLTSFLTALPLFAVLSPLLLRDEKVLVLRRATAPEFMAPGPL